MTRKTNRGIDLPETVAAHVAELKLLRGVRRLGLAVSGGADSVALVHLLLPICRAAGITVHVLHLNHGLRGRASDADQRFVERLAGACGVAGVIARATPRVKHAARGPHERKINPSLEMWARAERLAFFRRCVKDLRLDAIATAHQADDVAETVLLRLARGAGMAGLAGLKPRSVLHAEDAATLTLIRPLLACTRSDLRTWLRRHGHAWREDASNRDTAIPRNGLRQVVLPWLEQHWQPALRRQLARSAEILRAEDDWLNAQAEAALADVTGTRGALRHGALMRLPLALQRRVVRLWLMAHGHTGDAAGFDAVERVVRGVQGSGFRVRGSGFGPAAGLRPVRSEERTADCRMSNVECRSGHRHRPETLRCSAVRHSSICGSENRNISNNQPQNIEGAAHATAEGKQHAPIAIPGSTMVAGVLVTTRLAIGIARGQGPVGRLPATCSLDPAALAGRELTVRFRRPGDRIAPIGLHGSRKLQDILTDAKVPAAKRDTIPLLVCGDEIVWLPGYRVARAFAVRDPTAPAVQVRLARQPT